MLRKRGFFGRRPAAAAAAATQEDEASFFTPLEEALGLGVAALGLYSQIGNGLSFEIPFPLSLVTWPFELAERWIQWSITKNRDEPQYAL